MKRTLTAIFLGGLIAGMIDIGAASLISGFPLETICKFIAGGLLGKAALTGGTEIVALGVVLQWAMSWIIAAIYVIAAQWLPTLKRQWALCGILYGVPVFFVMNYVVVPLSAWHRWPNMAPDKFVENLAAMLLFGLIVAFFARRA